MSSTEGERPGWISRSAVMGCEGSASPSRTMMSPLLAERGRFWVGRVRSIIPGLPFRFLAFISLIGWNMVSFRRSMSFLSLGACELAPTSSCGPSAEARNRELSCLTINCKELCVCEEGYGTYVLGWIKDEEITLPVLLNFVSDHSPGVPCVLEHHRHTFRRGYRSI